jgi:hypothetical protein
MTKMLKDIRSATKKEYIPLTEKKKTLNEKVYGRVLGR